MSESDKSFITIFKRQLIIALIAYALITVSSFVGFYYNTQNSVDNLKANQGTTNARLDLYEFKLETLSKEKINKSDYIREIDEIKQMLRDINQKLDRR